MTKYNWWDVLMTKKNFVFVISLFALFAVDSAWANDTTGTSVGIAAVSYVDRALEPYATKTELENAKPVAATDKAAGLTKLYKNSGAGEDGTMTQKAITNQLANRLPVDGTAAKATADAEGNVITTTYATKTELDAIRSGAEAGATALQPGDVGELALVDVITDSDIAADANIAMSKIDGLEDALDGKLSASDYGYIPTNENGTGEARIWVE